MLTNSNDDNVLSQFFKPVLKSFQIAQIGKQ